MFVRELPQHRDLSGRDHRGSVSVVPPCSFLCLSDATPATRNDEALVERVVPVFRRVLGDDHVIPSEPSMGGEDFSEYGLAGVPIFMFRLGSVSADRLSEMKKAGQTPPSLHSPFYYPDARETITTGVTAMSAAVVDLLPVK